MATELINPAPQVLDRKDLAPRRRKQEATPEWEREPIDTAEIFEYIRDITDPEHPYTLEQLSVVAENLIAVDDAKGQVTVQFTPTVQHCSMATLIGLCIRVRLLRCLPMRFKIDVKLTPGSHSTEEAVNKQLADKERVAAALENPGLIGMVDKCLEGADRGR
ncbi:unnamed protein product [Pedinophyceae sp. YPF-701]|nr:unnamed protein product [Pedinophyceae sp. YPF-701]